MLGRMRGSSSIDTRAGAGHVRQQGGTAADAGRHRRPMPIIGVTCRVTKLPQTSSGSQGKAPSRQPTTN